MNLQGKNYIITGANKPRGIGFAVASALADLGANIGFIARNLEQQDKRIAELNSRDSLASQGTHISEFADFSDVGSVKKAVDAIANRYEKKIHGFLHFVGVFKPISVDDMTPETITRMTQINYNSALEGVAAAKPYLQINSRVVINASDAGLPSKVFAGQGLYGGPKAGLIQYVRILNVEFSQDIRALAIANGSTNSDGLEKELVEWEQSLVKEGKALHVQTQEGLKKVTALEYLANYARQPAEIADEVIGFIKDSSQYEDLVHLPAPAFDIK